MPEPGHTLEPISASQLSRSSKTEARRTGPESGCKRVQMRESANAAKPSALRPPDLIRRTVSSDCAKHRSSGNRQAGANPVSPVLSGPHPLKNRMPKPASAASTGSRLSDRSVSMPFSATASSPWRGGICSPLPPVLPVFDGVAIAMTAALASTVGPVRRRIRSRPRDSVWSLSNRPFCGQKTARAATTSREPDDRISDKFVRPMPSL